MTEASSADLADVGRAVRLAVVGLGKMGIMHTTMVQACRRADLAALVDRDLSLCRHVQSMGTEAPAFQDLGEMLEQVQPDGVILATPQFTHRKLIEQALGAEVHVLTEKPLAHTLAEARQAAAAADRAAKLVRVAFMKGHDPVFRRAALLLRESALDEMGALPQKGPAVAGTKEALGGDPRGVLGRLCGFQASVHLGQVFRRPKGWTFTREKAGGGVLINTGVHLLFLLRMCFGPLRRVACAAKPIHADTEDTLSALAEHEPVEGDRFAGTVHVSWSTAGYETEGTEIVVQGTNGTLWVEDNLLKLWLVEAAGGLAQGWHAWRRADLESPDSTFNLSPEYSGEGYYREVENFAFEILGDPRGFGFDARTGLELQTHLDAYYRSAEQSGAWTEPEQT